MAKAIFCAAGASIQGFCDACGGMLLIFRMELTEPPFVAERLFHPESEQLGYVLADHIRNDLLSFESEGVNDGGTMIEQLVQLRVGGLKRVFGLLARGNVVHH